MSPLPTVTELPFEALRLSLLAVTVGSPQSAPPAMLTFTRAAVPHSSLGV